jgi:3-methyladenine DNA glycosylase AlkD
MTADQLLAELESLGTAQNRKIYARHGVGGPCFGVSYANFGKLKKRIKTDHALAEALWDSGNHDARVLATMIADPRAIAGSRLDAWAKSLDNSPLAGALSQFAAETPFAAARARKWTKSRSELLSTTGWTLLAILAAQDGVMDDAELAGFLSRIEAEIHAAPNRTRYAMNNALIAIGGREALREEALAAAGRIGRVEVDHGETGCKTPDAAAYIRKMADRKAKRTGC